MAEIVLYTKYHNAICTLQERERPIKTDCEKCDGDVQ